MNRIIRITPIRDKNSINPATMKAITKFVYVTKIPPINGPS
ncbi:MAG: hypothetical protein ACW98X_27435 [Promethearchaeota archaeon]